MTGYLIAAGALLALGALVVVATGIGLSWCFARMDAIDADAPVLRDLADFDRKRVGL